MGVNGGLIAVRNLHKYSYDDLKTLECVWSCSTRRSGVVMTKKRMETLAIKQDPASCLPWDMVQKIAALLPDEDVVGLESCSRQWRMICSSDRVWYVLCRRRWPTLFSNESVLDQLKEQMCVSDPSTKRWKSFYTTRHKVMKATAASIIGNRNTYMVSENSKDLLASVHFSLRDVELFLFRPHLKVLFNILGLSYCSKLNVHGKRVVKSLRRCNIQERKYNGRTLTDVALNRFRFRFCRRPRRNPMLGPQWC